MDILEIKKAIKERNEPLLRSLMVEHNLEIKNGKIIPKNQDDTKKLVEFWDQRQQARKILLNCSI